MAGAHFQRFDVKICVHSGKPKTKVKSMKMATMRPKMIAKSKKKDDSDSRNAKNGIDEAENES